ncbi:MAG: acyl-CoA dehydrogenase family protein [Gammaproteobacteria bacterium]
MERHHLESEHHIFRESVRRFFQKEVEPHRERWHAAGLIDREIYQKGGAQGLLLMQADEQYGGAGIDDFRYEQILIEENLRYGDSGLYFTLHSRLVAPYLEGLGTDEQKRRFLPACARGDKILGIAMTEPGAGSDLAGIRTRAEERDDHYLLNGAKTYISNGINGDVFVVAARTGPDRQLGLFLVERDMPGFARGRNLKKMGLNSQDTAELFFENVRVPKSNVLGDPARGFYYLMQYLTEERLISAAQYVAASQIAFDLTMDYIRERRIFGRAVGDFQVNRFKMADMRTQIDIAQVFVDHCVLEFNAGRLTAADVARAKLHCSELEGRVTDECVQLHGGAGYMDEYRISRMYRDARVSRIYAGSSEVMREIIARSIGLDPRHRPDSD